MTTPATKPNPVVFIHGLWIHATGWQPWLDLFETRGYRASAPGWPGDGPTVAATRENARRAQQHRHPADGRALHRTHRNTGGKARRGRAFVRRPDRAEAAGQRRGCGGRRDRPRPHQGRVSAALRAAEVRIPGAGQSGESAPIRLADSQAVPLRLRQRSDRKGIRRSARRMDDPRRGPSPLSGRRCELPPTLVGEGRHPPGRTGTAAADLGNQGPHRAR